MEINEQKINKSKRITAFNWKKLLLIVLIVFTTGIIAVFGINGYVKASTRDMFLTPEQTAELNADCIIVLGAGVSGDQPSYLLRDRIQRGVDLYFLGASGKLLMSGDHGRDDYDEVNVMKNFAVQAGVPSSDVFMDHAGFSTYESLYRAQDIFQVQSIVIVTQRYHLYRALYIARSLGLEAYGVAAEDIDYPGQAYRDAREVLARNKDFVFAIIKPKPTYLGDVIPITGDGDITFG